MPPWERRGCFLLWDSGNCGLLPFFSPWFSHSYLKFTFHCGDACMPVLWWWRREIRVCTYLLTFWRVIWVLHFYIIESVGWDVLFPESCSSEDDSQRGMCNLALDFHLDLLDFGWVSGSVWVFHSVTKRGRRRMIYVSCFWCSSKSILCFWGLLLLI